MITRLVVPCFNQPSDDPVVATHAQLPMQCMSTIFAVEANKRITVHNKVQGFLRGQIGSLPV